MKFIDLFAGIGGFHHGLEKANHSTQFTTEKCKQTEFEKEPESRRSRSSDERGRIDILPGQRKQHGNRNFECVWANEWDKYASAVYQKRFPSTPFSRADITTVDIKKIPSHELLVAGFPCQAFSVAGKRGGFDDTRGTLFFEIARILKSHKPSLVLLENVKGLLSHDNGYTFATILQTLDELRYDVEWQVLNSKDFSVPQTRERVFIVGHLRGKRTGQVFPIAESNRWNNEERKNYARQKNIAWALRGRDYKDGTNFVVEKKKDVRGTAWRTRTYMGQPGHLEEREDNLANQMTSVQKDSLVSLDDDLRKLMPIECERLQAFPDNWTEGLSDAQRWKCLGNAVTTNVVQAIGERILEDF